MTLAPTTTCTVWIMVVSDVTEAKLQSPVSTSTNSIHQRLILSRGRWYFRRSFPWHAYRLSWSRRTYEKKETRHLGDRANKVTFGLQGASASPWTMYWIASRMHTTVGSTVKRKYYWCHYYHVVMATSCWLTLLAQCPSRTSFGWCGGGKWQVVPSKMWDDSHTFRRGVTTRPRPSIFGTRTRWNPYESSRRRHVVSCRVGVGRDVMSDRWTPNRWHGGFG